MAELQEKNFIAENYRLNPYPLIFSGLIVAVSIALIQTGAYLAERKVSKQLTHSPFLRVTNREFSSFLWHYPQFMRVHAKNKIGYLPGFQYLHKINMELEFSENEVIAPPNVLFFYHTWKRLVSFYEIQRPIFLDEFKEFLSHLDEWQPKNWLAAPKEYDLFISSLHELKNFNLVSLSENELPKQVRQAFYGWKNYFKEGVAINAFNPSFLQLDEFLKQHTNYKRNYWINIISDEYPNYLKTYSKGEFEINAIVPREEIAPFLRLALYNAYVSN